MHRRHGVTHAMPETVCAWTPALDPRAARAQTRRPPPSAVECARAGATATNMPLPNQCHAAPLAPLASELCRCTRRRCECTPVPRCTTRRSRMIGCAVGRRLCLSAPRLQMTRRSTPCMCAKFCGVTNRHSYNFLWATTRRQRADNLWASPVYLCKKRLRRQRRGASSHC